MLRLYVITEPNGRVHRVVADRVLYLPDGSDGATVYFSGAGVPERTVHLGHGAAKATIHFEELPPHVVETIIARS